MTEKEFKVWLRESFDKIAEAFPHVLIDYGIDFNSKKDRYEITYFCVGRDKEGYGAAFIKKDQLADENYIAQMKANFIPNMTKACREHFSRIIIP